MADNAPPQPTHCAPDTPIQKKRKSSKLEAAGRLKAKAKAISGKIPSKAAEKEASRRHLEKQFSKIQKLNAGGTVQASPVPTEGSLFNPQLAPSSSLVQQAWSLERDTGQEEVTPLSQSPCP